MPEPLSTHDGLLAVFERARTIGLLGRGPVESHIDHAYRFVRAVSRPPTHGLDIGSGAGVPGLVLALHWPEASWALLDGAQKRVDFLQWAVEELGIDDRVQVLGGRAEVLAHDPSLRGAFDLVTARSFAAPAVTAECATGFLQVGGRLVVSEPPSGEVRWSAEGLAELNMAVDESAEPFMAVIVQQSLCPERFPRRVGIPEKRPLFG